MFLRTGNPLANFGVALAAVAVGVAHEIHPVPRPVFDHAVFFTAGGGGFRIGWRLRHVLRSASSFSHGTVSDFAGWSRGSGAPIAIYLSKSAMTASLSFGRFDGIFRSGSSWRMDFRSRFFSGLPEMIVSPESPPFFQPSRKSRRRPPFCFFASWHSWHSPVMTGRIFVSKKSACSCVSVVAASAALPMRGEMKGAPLLRSVARHFGVHFHGPRINAAGEIRHVGEALLE